MDAGGDESQPPMSYAKSVPARASLSSASTQSALEELREKNKKLVGQLKAKGSGTTASEVSSAGSLPYATRQTSEPAYMFYAKQASEGQGSNAPSDTMSGEQRYLASGGEDELFVRIVRELSESHGRVSHNIVNSMGDVQREMQQDVAEIKAALEALTSEVRSVIAEEDRHSHNELKGRLDALSQKIGALHSQDLPGGLRVLKESLDTCEKMDSVRAQEAIVSLNTLKDLLLAHGRELQALKSQDMGEMVATFQTVLEEHFSELQRTREQFTQKAEEEKSAVNLVQKELEAHAREQTALKSQLDASEASMNQEKVEAENLVRSVGDLKDVVATCTSEMQEVTASTAVRQEHMRKLQEGMLASNVQLKELLEQSQAMEGATAAQKEELQALESAVQLQAQHERLKAELEACRWKNEQRQVLHQELTRSLKEDISRLRCESMRLKARQPMASSGARVSPLDVHRVVPLLGALIGGAGIGVLSHPALRRAVFSSSSPSKAPARSTVKPRSGASPSKSATAKRVNTASSPLPKWLQSLLRLLRGPTPGSKQSRSTRK
mmetsp:Transcript_12408/g.29207  ORF Transcript_12408/g.29207 Transcript_12408/m.29207 type:complete len:553 (-) Transcript_12408:133-1791(-)